MEDVFKAEKKKRTATLIADMPIDQYHMPESGVSKSMLSEMECPLRYKYKYIDKLEENTDKDHFNVGNAVHTLALEPAEFDKRFYVIEDGIRRDKRTDSFKAEIDRANGRKMITAKDYSHINGMANSLRADKMAMAILSRKGLIEASILWHDEEYNMPLKARPDFLGDDGLIVDLKTADSSRPNDFYRNAFDYGYDISVALTTRAYQALYGKNPENYVFVVVEKKPPYPVTVYDTFRPWAGQEIAPLSFYNVGKHRLDIYMNRLNTCIKSGVWPSYQQTIEPMAVPAYALKNLEME